MSDAVGDPRAPWVAFTSRSASAILQPSSSTSSEKRRQGSGDSTASGGSLGVSRRGCSSGSVDSTEGSTASTSAFASSTSSPLHQHQHRGTGGGVGAGGASPFASPLGPGIENRSLEALSSLSTKLGSLFSTQTSSSSTNEPQIPKEELMHLSMKLNKRLKALEARTTELTHLHKEAVHDRNEIVSFLVMEVLKKDVPADGMHMTMAIIQSEWAKVEEQRNMTLREIQKRHQEYVQAKEEEVQLLKSSLKASTSTLPQQQQAQKVGGGGMVDSDDPLGAGLLNAAPSTQRHQREAVGEENGRDDSTKRLAELMGQLKKEQLEAEVMKDELIAAKDLTDKLRNQVANQGRSLDEERDRVVALRTELASAQSGYEEKVVYLQMQLQGMKKAEEASRAATEKAEQKARTLRAELDAQNERVIKGEAAIKRLGELEQQVGASSILLREKEAVLEDLRQKVSRLRSDKLELESTIKNLEERQMHSSAQRELLEDMTKQREQVLARSQELRNELDEARQSLSEKNALLTRLRGEMEASEKTHATRTTQVASLEQRAQALNAEISALKKEHAEARSLIADLRSDLDHAKRDAVDAQARLKSEMEDRIIEKEKIEKEMWAKAEEHLQAHQKTREAHEEEVASLKREFQKKSALAREMINEKDTQVKTLTARVEELESEIASGGHSERKIMELAAAQSRRETQQRAEVDSCKVSIGKLQQALANKDLELAKLTAEHGVLNTEMTGLRMVRRREEVNLEYLKNIVVEYMSFPSGTSEYSSLELVIGTLLAFSPSDLRKIQEGRKTGLAWLLAPPRRPVKEISSAVHRRSNPPTYPPPTPNTGPLIRTAGGAGVSPPRRRKPYVSPAFSKSSSQSSMDGSLACESLDGSVGSSGSLSVSDFRSLSGHGGGGGGAQQGGQESPIRPAHVGLFRGGGGGSSTISGSGGNLGGGPENNPHPIVSL